MATLVYAEEECELHVLSFVVFLSTLALQEIMPSSCCAAWLDDVTSSLDSTLSFDLGHFLLLSNGGQPYQEFVVQKVGLLIKVMA